MKIVDMPPSGASVMSALRGIGYSLATSLADLVDNSVAAGARSIAVSGAWRDGCPMIEVVDDGAGMSRDTLVRKAMRIGSGPGARSPGDLGRFGLGLKTASFAQGRMLTVATLRDGHLSVARWDLDLVCDSDEWSLIEDPDLPASAGLSRLRTSGSGTLVRIESIDRFTAQDLSRGKATFQAALTDAAKHLASSFHRFMEEGLRIRVGRTTLEARNPIPVSHPATVQLPTLVVGESSPVSVTGFICPADEEPRREGAGVSQGFYVYRGGRLLAQGGWLGLGSEAPWAIEDQYRLSRVLVELQTDADSEWQIDIKKASARIPASLREPIRIYAEDARAKARRVLHSKYAPVTRPVAGPSQPLWVPTGTDRPRYKINRSHPSLVPLIDLLGPRSDLLRLIENDYPHDLTVTLGDSEIAEPTRYPVMAISA